MDYSSLIQMYQQQPTSTFACLVYGYSGSGKTTFGGTFPEPFFIDADRGLKSLSNSFPYLQLQSTKTPFTLVLNILQDALQGVGPWAKDGPLGKTKTIVIDSLTSLVDDYLMPEAMTEGRKNSLSDKPTFDEYGKIKSRLTALASLIKDLSQKYYIVMTALVEEEKDENSGELIGKPMVTGKYRDKAQADYDEVYYLMSVSSMTGPMTYKLFAQPYKWYRAKTRLTTIKSIDDPNFQKIVANFKKKGV